MVGDKRTELFIHIGHYKTGTSALQDYLHHHADGLLQQNVLYPASNRPKRNPTNHGNLSLSLGQEFGFVPPQWYGEDVPSAEAFAALHEEIGQSTAQRVVISSEEFVQLALIPRHEEALAALKAHVAAYDTRIVFYIREPFSLLKSWYNQVNKGPIGTRNFPTFFANLRSGFLAQGAIYERYAQVFGAENVILKPYASVGAAHIRSFAELFGVTLDVVEDTPLVNEAQPLDKLELIRLAKDRHHSFDEATLTDMKSAEAFAGKASRISATFDTMAAEKGLDIRSKLTAEAIIRYYAQLIAPARDLTPLNPEEAHNLRDHAISIEDSNLPLALALMETAHILKPQGHFIAKKIADYRERFGAQNQS